MPENPQSLNKFIRRANALFCQKGGRVNVSNVSVFSSLEKCRGLGFS